MKRTYTDKNNTLASSNLISLEGYVVHVNAITKNHTNENHHYSFIVSREDQSTVRVVKYLSKVASCSLYHRLQESLRSGEGASISCLRENDGQYTCTFSTTVIEKELDFRPECIRVKHVIDLKNETNERLCTVEAKICYISDEIPIMFEENRFKRVQKMKKNIIIGDSTGALTMTIWESHFNHVLLGESYHIRLLKVRMYNDQISLTATTDTSFIKIDDLQTVITTADNSVNRFHTSKGRIISVGKIDNYYRCQGCGSMNVIDQTTFVSCSDCNSRLLKDPNINEDCMKITILTSNNEEYNLKIAKSLVITVLTESISYAPDHDSYINYENKADDIISKVVDFTYSETTGEINHMSIVVDNESTDESTYY